VVRKALRRKKSGKVIVVVIDENASWRRGAAHYAARLHPLTIISNCCRFTVIYYCRGCVIA
jgi:hypothetical protein